MADAQTDPLYQGEARFAFASAAADSGTLTVAVGATYTLYDQTGTIVTGHNAQAVDGYDSPAATVRVWKKISTLTPAVLTVQYYKVVFKFSATSSVSGQSEDYVRTVVVPVRAVPA
jgi:hypothetical protein